MWWRIYDHYYPLKKWTVIAHNSPCGFVDSVEVRARTKIKAVKMAKRYFSTKILSYTELSAWSEYEEKEIKK